MYLLLERSIHIFMIKTRKVLYLILIFDCDGPIAFNDLMGKAVLASFDGQIDYLIVYNKHFCAKPG